VWTWAGDSVVMVNEFILGWTGSGSSKVAELSTRDPRGTFDTFDSGCDSGGFSL
jgi:hypothetical protein